MRSVEMANRHKYTSASFAFVLLLLPLVLWGSSRPVPAATSLSVGFVGLTNGPARQVKPTRIEVCQGATGLCAMFSARAVSSNRWIWFKTASIEQKPRLVGRHSCRTALRGPVLMVVTGRPDMVVFMQWAGHLAFRQTRRGDCESAMGQSHQDWV
jgi:hypothetical protein